MLAQLYIICFFIALAYLVLCSKDRSVLHIVGGAGLLAAIAVIGYVLITDLYLLHIFLQSTKG